MILELLLCRVPNVLDCQDEVHADYSKDRYAITEAVGQGIYNQIESHGGYGILVHCNLAIDAALLRLCF